MRGKNNQPMAVFSLFTAPEHMRLTKALCLDDDGNLLKTAPQNAGSGRIETVRMQLSELPAFMASLGTNQCLVHGVVHDSQADKGPLRVIPKARRKDGGGTISRSREFFRYPAGPGLAMLDYDPNPDHGHEFTPNELIAAIDRDVIPGFASAATVAALSTSSKVYQGDELKSTTGKPGFHLYFVAIDGGDIPRFGEMLFKRLWLKGYGHGMLSTVGSFLKRGAIDASVFQPERCDFVAGAVLKDGLTQQRPDPEYRHGGCLDTTLLHDLLPEEEAKYQRLVNAERQRLKPEQEPKRREYAAKLAEKTGENVADIIKRLEDGDRGEIDADEALDIWVGQPKVRERMTIREMVKRGLHGEYIEDPVEDTNTRAILFLGGRVGPHIHSFLHGGTNLRIMGLDAADLPRDVGVAQGVDLEGKSLKDSLALLEKSDYSSGVARAIINRFAGNIPCAYSAAELAEKITSRTSEVEGVADYIATHTDRHRKLAAELTAITAAITELDQANFDNHRYKEIKHHEMKIRPKHNIWSITGKLMPGVIILKAPHGIGKTKDVGTLFADDAKVDGEKFVATCHRISLVDELGKRLGLDSYHERVTEQGLAVCVNSIIAPELKDYCATAENVFIDEFSQVLTHIVGDAVKDKKQLYAQFKEMVSNAKRLIISDADLSDRDIEWLTHCRPDKPFRIYEIKPDNSALHCTFQQGRKAADVAMGAIISDLDAEKHLIVATDSKKKAAKLEELIAKERPDVRCLSVHRGNADGERQTKFTEDPNGQCVEYDILIHSPTISSGISIEVDHFDSGYGLFYGVVAPSDAIQMMRRARKLKHWHLSFDMNPPRENEDSASRTFGREMARKDFSIGTETSELELLKDHIDGWKAKGCNNFARNMLYLLETSGFHIERLVADGEDYDDASIKSADAAATAKWIEGILDAKDIEKHEYEELKRNKLTPTKAAEIERFKIKDALKLENLTTADVEFYDYGRGLRRLKDFELAAGIVTPYDPSTYQGDWALRESAKARHLPLILAPLGLDLLKGIGTYGKAEAENVVHLVMETPTYMDWLGVGHVVHGRRPKHAVKFVNHILKKLGLKAKGKQVRKGEDREWRYGLDPAVFEDVYQRAQHRHRKSTRPTTGYERPPKRIPRHARPAKI
jgi:hypothetical protein